MLKQFGGEKGEDYLKRVKESFPPKVGPGSVRGKKKKKRDTTRPDEVDCSELRGKKGNSLRT